MTIAYGLFGFSTDLVDDRQSDSFRQPTGRNEAVLRTQKLVYHDLHPKPTDGQYYLLVDIGQHVSRCQRDSFRILGRRV